MKRLNLTSNHSLRKCIFDLKSKKLHLHKFYFPTYIYLCKYEECLDFRKNYEIFEEESVFRLRVEIGIIISKTMLKHFINRMPLHLTWGFVSRKAGLYTDVWECLCFFPNLFFTPKADLFLSFIYIARFINTFYDPSTVDSHKSICSDYICFEKRLCLVVRSEMGFSFTDDSNSACFIAQSVPGSLLCARMRLLFCF